MPATATPVLTTERSPILDALRGFALLGVLIDNLFGFTGWGSLTMPQREALPTWPADGILSLLELTFIQGKFYSTFSLLFGIGFSVIMIRSEQKGINGLSLFYRRLFILLLIGAIHCIFVWDGDILMLYALLGMLLPLFRKCSDKTLVITAGLLILSPILIDGLRILFHFSPGSFLKQQAIAIDIKNNVPIDEVGVSQYLYSTEAAWTHFRNWTEPGFFYRYAYLLDSNRLPKVFAMFLLGLCAGRKLIYLHPEQYIPLFRKLRKWGFIIGISAAIANTFFYIDNKHIPAALGLADTFFYAFSVVPLCLAYVSWFCLHWIKTKGQSRWQVVIPVGRMALTNYLMQTVFGILLYYGFAFGLGGDIGPAIFIPIGLAVYGFQIIYSSWWLRHFNYGPMEWIWRQLTYLKRLPFRKRVKLLQPLD